GRPAPRPDGGLTKQGPDDRRTLLTQFDTLRRDLDATGTMGAMDRYNQQAIEMLVGRRAQEAFDLSREPQPTRERYGKHLWCQQALLARRLVEAGVAFVTLDLSYHTPSGTWGTHGGNIPPHRGLTPGPAAPPPLL